MTHKLLPCPFCGGKAKYVSYRTSEDSEACQVSCGSCDARTNEFEDAYAPSEDAIDAWNRRASTPAPQPISVGSEAVAIQALKKIEDAALGGYLTPDLCAEIVTNALAPDAIVMGMDEEDRTAAPVGYDVDQWRKADQVHHATALVADDTECVKIIYAALLSAVRDGVEETLQIATDQARMMADLAIEGLSDNTRQREAMEAALTRFSQNLRVTLEGFSAPTPSAIKALQAIADLPTPKSLERMNGHEDAYRAIERLFATPPNISASPSPVSKESP